MLALVLAAMACTVRRRTQSGMGRWRAALLPLTLGLLLTLVLAGCSSNAPHNQGTPPGTYKLTVTGSTGSGSSALSHSVTLTLTVS